MTDNYQILQTLILKSEGKTLEDELGFGCRLNLENRRELIYLTHMRIKGSEGKSKIELDLFSNSTGAYNEWIDEEFQKGFVTPLVNHKEFKDRFEILGKDIGLERVLRALEKHNPITYYLQTSGQIMDDEEGNLICEWELGKPGHKQSEETITKLIELLS